MAKRGRPRKSGSGKGRSGYNRSYYVKNRNKILKYMRARYRRKRSKILTYQKRYRRLTKNGKKPFYMSGRKGGKRPKFGRLPRVHQYRFIRGGKVGRGSKTSTGSNRRGRGSNSSTGGRKPMGGGRTRAFAKRKK